MKNWAQFSVWNANIFSTVLICLFCSISSKVCSITDLLFTDIHQLDCAAHLSQLLSHHRHHAMKLWPLQHVAGVAFDCNPIAQSLKANKHVALSPAFLTCKLPVVTWWNRVWYNSTKRCSVVVCSLLRKQRLNFFLGAWSFGGATVVTFRTCDGTYSKVISFHFVCGVHENIKESIKRNLITMTYKYPKKVEHINLSFQREHSLLWKHKCVFFYEKKHNYKMNNNLI